MKKVLGLLTLSTAVIIAQDFFPKIAFFDPFTAAERTDNFGGNHPRLNGYYAEQMANAGFNIIHTKEENTDNDPLYLDSIHSHGFFIFSEKIGGGLDNESNHSYIYSGYEEKWPVGYDEEKGEYEKHLSDQYYSVNPITAEHYTINNNNNNNYYYFRSIAGDHNPGLVLDGSEKWAGYWQNKNHIHLFVNGFIDNIENVSPSDTVVTFEIYESNNTNRIEPFPVAEYDSFMGNINTEDDPPSLNTYYRSFLVEDFITPGFDEQVKHIDPMYFNNFSQEYETVTHVNMYWHGNVDFYLDGFELRSTKNHNLFTAIDSINTYQELKGDFKNIYENNGGQMGILYRFYHDEPKFNQYHSLGKLNELAIDTTDIPFICALPPNGNIGIRQHEYARLANPSEVLYNKYVIRGAGAGNFTSHHSDYVPTNIPYYNKRTLQEAWDDLILTTHEISFYSQQEGRPFLHTVQVHSSLNDNGYFKSRNPLVSEISAQVWLAIALNAKGIMYFLYSTGDFDSRKYGLVAIDGNNNGVVDPEEETLFDPSQGPYIPNEKYYEVQKLNSQLDILAPHLLNLNWQNTYSTSDSNPNETLNPNPAAMTVESVTSLEYPEQPYIQIAHFQHDESGEEYFMLVNRRCCLEDDGECIEKEDQTLTVAIDLSEQMVLEDVIASKQPWDGDEHKVAYRVISPENNQFTVHLEPGEGKLFRLTSDISGTIESDIYFSGEVMIKNDLTFTSNAIMKVYGGTKLQFSQNSHLFFDAGASIQVEGEDNNRAIFKSIQEGGSWSGIWVLDTTPHDMHINHANILNADIGFYTNFNFHYNNNRKSINGPATITNPIFLDNVNFHKGQAGVFVQNVPELIIDQCSIVEQEVLGALFESSDVIMNNTIILNNGYVGIETIDSDITIKDAWIQGNGNSSQDGAGIYANYFSRVNMNHTPQPLVPCLNNHNRVIGNKIGIFISSESHGDFGWYRPNDPQDRYGYNEIHSNADLDIKSESFLNAQLTFWNDDLDGSGPNGMLLSGNIFYDPPAPLVGDSICIPSLPIHPETVSGGIEDWFILLQDAVNAERNGDDVIALDLYSDLSVSNYPVQIRKTGIKGVERISRKSGGAELAVSFLDNVLGETINNSLLIDIKERKAVNMSYSSDVFDGLTIITQLLDQTLEEETIARLLYRQSILTNALSGVGRVALDEGMALESIVDQYPKTTTAKLIQLKSLLMHSQKQDEPKYTMIPKSIFINKLTPNPFNPTTKIEVETAEKGLLFVRIFDIQGRNIKTFQKKVSQSSSSQLIWDGKNFQGENVASGVYIITSSLTQDDGRTIYSNSRKGVLLK